MTPARSGVLLRRLLPEDAEAAANVERACFSVPWSERVYHATLLLPYSYYYGAFRGNELIGTAGLQIIAGEGEISNVAVLAKARRRGIAGDLLRLALSNAQGFGISDFTLEVREGNTAALSLYESFGFQIEGRRRNYYTNPTEDALIMWRRSKRKI